MARFRLTHFDGITIAGVYYGKGSIVELTEDQARQFSHGLATVPEMTPLTPGLRAETPNMPPPQLAATPFSGSTVPHLTAPAEPSTAPEEPPIETSATEDEPEFTNEPVDIPDAPNVASLAAPEPVEAEAEKPKKGGRKKAPEPAE